MPPLSDDDRKEVSELLTKSLGLAEGKTLADTISELTNAEINKYDKRTKKDRDALGETLKGLGESVKVLVDAKKEADEKGGGGDPPGTGTGGTPDLAKLDPAVRDLIQSAQREQKKLAERLEAAEKASAEEKAAREKVEAENARRTMLDAVRAAATGKDVGVDPEKADFLLDHLEHRQMVRMNEMKTGYEVQVGKEKSGEPIWEPLGDGLKSFVKTQPGAFFLPAVPGAGGGSGAGGGTRRSAGALSAEQIAAMPTAEVERLAGEGKLTIE